MRFAVYEFNMKLETLGSGRNGYFPIGLKLAGKIDETIHDVVPAIFDTEEAAKEYFDYDDDWHWIFRTSTDSPQPHLSFKGARRIAISGKPLTKLNRKSDYENN